MSSYQCQAKIFRIQNQKSKPGGKKPGGRKPEGKKSSVGEETTLYNSRANVFRFVEAYQNGIVSGTEYKRYETSKRTYELDRKGDNIEKVISELKNNNIKNKKACYIWYVFPQPNIIKKGDKCSDTRKFYFISDKEVVAFLRHPYLSVKLDEALSYLVAKNLDKKQLGKYFNPSDIKNQDDFKFYHFRNKFLEIINILLQEAPDDKDDFVIFLKDIKTKLEVLEIF